MKLLIDGDNVYIDIGTHIANIGILDFEDEVEYPDAKPITEKALRSLLNGKYHVKSDGQRVLIEDMHDKHLMNAINKMEKESLDNNPSEYRNLVAEAGRRNLI